MLTLTVVVILAACKQTPGADAVSPRTIPVITYTVQYDSVQSALQLSGNIDANTTVKLGFLVAGKIQQFGWNEGDRISKGQLVAQLDPANYQIAKEMADVQVKQVEDEFQRIKILHERNSVSESDFKKVEYTLQSALTQQKLQQKNLTDTRLYAPITGVVLKKLSENGEIVSTGYPIVVLADINKVKVNAYLPETQLQDVRIGQTATVSISALGETFTGKVKEIAGAAEATTRAFTIRIEIDNPQLKIKPGMIADVQLSGQQKKSILQVPLSTIIRTTEGQTYVYTVDKEKGQAFQRNISIGAINGENVEVITGLAAGETIVSGGQQKLANGSFITITTN
ncbi:efflux RND transporter periplasmic adaptor subunit [Gynurincola endophyticus]|uniref:efflux RND transporter periplasmic adaptor subunit n=1 Tax=Gynurincola endophyticus TaxID=2479004 RepID=UPI001315393C|nr:efflux RND transporter periplasmic adaptor subunit [Gynurincola endophyticus]